MILPHLVKNTNIICFRKFLDSSWIVFKIMFSNTELKLKVRCQAKWHSIHYLEKSRLCTIIPWRINSVEYTLIPETHTPCQSNVMLARKMENLQTLILPLFRKLAQNSKSSLLAITIGVDLLPFIPDLTFFMICNPMDML